MVLIISWVRSVVTGKTPPMNTLIKKHEHSSYCLLLRDYLPRFSVIEGVNIWQPEKSAQKNYSYVSRYHTMKQVKMHV